jgi:hypothetical protein
MVLVWLGPAVGANTSPAAAAARIPTPIGLATALRRDNKPSFLIRIIVLSRPAVKNDRGHNTYSPIDFQLPPDALGI